MKYLLDTSPWLWSLTEPERVNSHAFQIITEGREELYFSAVTAWEIAIKSALGKLRLPLPPAVLVPKAMAEQGLRHLLITHAQALRVASLPHHHNDPFDRLLIAQAQSEDMTILTADRAFQRYEVEILWCGR